MRYSTPTYSSDADERAAPRSTKEARLHALQKRAKEIKAEIADLEQQQAARKRKEDTRAKILVGAAILADVALHPENLDLVRAILGRAVTAPRDVEFLTEFFRARKLIDAKERLS